jgi:DNA-binding HxlR family transcriptional regulator
MAIVRKKKTTTPTVSRMVEDVVGCKWSMSVLACIRKGVVRPGAMQRALDGVSTKVLNERLAKLVRYGVVAKTVHAEVPPRVEYRLTAFGRRFAEIIDGIEALQREID